MLASRCLVLAFAEAPRRSGAARDHALDDGRVALPFRCSSCPAAVRLMRRSDRVILDGLATGGNLSSIAA